MRPKPGFKRTSKNVNPLKADYDSHQPGDTEKTEAAFRVYRVRASLADSSATIPHLNPLPFEKGEAGRSHRGKKSRGRQIFSSPPQPRRG